MKQRIQIVGAFLFAACMATFGAAGASLESLNRDAIAAMQNGKYAKAADLLEEVLALRPGQNRTLYNLACCYSRTEKLEQAATRLQEAWDAGFRDLERLRSDPDLDALRDTQEGSMLVTELLAEGEEYQQLRGKPEFFDAPVIGGFRTVTPLHATPGDSYPLVVMLHGHGASPEHFVGVFNLSAAGLAAIFCAPYGPYPIALEHGHGYSWYPPPWLYREVLITGGPLGDREDHRAKLDNHEQQISSKFVLAAIDAAKQRHPVDPEKVFLLGHSEGGVLAYGIALRNPELFRGLIVVGSRLRDRDSTPETLQAAAGKLPVMICHSREDDAISFDHATKALERLRAAGVESKVVAYPGGHSLTVELVQHIAAWIQDQLRSVSAD